MTEPRAPLALRDARRQINTVAIAERFFDAFALFGLFELDVFAHLADGPRSLEELHERVGGNGESLRALLDAGVALGLLRGSAAGYTASEDLVACLADPGAPAYLGEWVRFLHALAPAVGDFAEVVRSGEARASLFEDGGGDTRPGRAMTRAMDAYARTRGRELGTCIDFAETRRLLDVGCGPGTYALELLVAYPRMHATLLDLPGPAAVAAELARERGLAERVEVVSGDARTYAPREPHDTVLISNVLHMIGPAEAAALLRRAHGFLAPGGRILVQAEYLDEARTSPRWPTLLNLILRSASPDGRNHSVEETTEWLAAAGFVDVRHERLSVVNVNSVLVARRPA